MSVRAMTWVWDQSIPPNAKIVLLAIADHAGDDGRDAWPSKARLARMTGYSERQIQRIVGDLVAHGVLVVEEEGGVIAGRNRTPRYRVVMNAPVAIDRTEFADGPPSPELRAEIIEAFDRTCNWCGEEGTETTGPDGSPWEMDRLVTRRKGGRYTRENVVLSCRPCNRRRGDRTSPPPVSPPGDGDDSPGEVTDVSPGESPVSREPSMEPSTRTVQEDTSSPSGDIEDDRDRGFDVFWEAYPRRNGKKLGKAKARTKWRALSYENKRAAYAAVKNYAAAVEAGATIARDAERFLASKWWEEWLDGPGETPAAKTARGSSAQVKTAAQEYLERRTGS